MCDVYYDYASSPPNTFLHDSPRVDALLCGRTPDDEPHVRDSSAAMEFCQSIPDMATANRISPHAVLDPFGSIGCGGGDPAQVL